MLMVFCKASKQPVFAPAARPSCSARVVPRAPWLAALLDMGVGDIRIVNRTRAHAEALQKAFSPAPLALFGWDQCAAALKVADLLVNATSLGLKGQAAAGDRARKLAERSMGD